MTPATPSEPRLLGPPPRPPPRLPRVVNTVRRGLLGAHRRSAPPSVRVLEAVFGLFENRVRGPLVEPGVPEALDHAQTATELAATVGVDAGALARVLRYAAGRGF